jgi:DNA modification methylase
MNRWLNQVHHGDCLEIMREMPDGCVDLCLTDPPYGISMDKGFEGFEGFGGFGKKIARRQYLENSWDDSRPSRNYFDEILRISKNSIIFGGNFFTDFLPVGTHWIVWDKMNTMPSFGDCELAWTSINRKSVAKVRVTYNGLIGKEPERIHPTQKPVALGIWILQKYSKPTDIIFDPMMGSGSFCVAAARLGRQWIGCDNHLPYVEMARARIARETQQLSMFTQT